MVLEGVEVHGDAQRGADLVLTTVTTTDGTGLVVVDHPFIEAQVVGQVLCHGLQFGLLAQRQHRGLDRGQTRVEPQHGALVHATLGVRGLVHIVGIHEEAHQGAGQAGGRFDDVRHVLLAGGLVEVAQVFAGVLGVRAQIVIGTVGDAFELAPVGTLEAELVFDVHGALGVVGELLLRVLVVAQVLRLDAEVDVPAGAGVDPVLVPFLIGAGRDEELHLHLLELTGAEDEVARGDLVTEGLTHVGDAERRLGTGGGHHVLEVHEDALRSLRTQVVQAVLVLDRAEVGAQHHVEVARFGPLATGAAVRADDVLHAVFRHLVAVLLGVGFLELVGAVALVAVEALDERIVEHAHVAGRHPHFGRQNDGSVDTDDIRTGDDHGAPPFTLDIVLESDAEGAVIPSGTGATVNFAGGEHEAATLRKGYDFIEFGLSHNAPSGLNGLGSNNNRFRIAVYGDRSGGIVRYMFRVSRAAVRSDSYIANTSILFLLFYPSPIGTTDIALASQIREMLLGGGVHISRMDGTRQT